MMRLRRGQFTWEEVDGDLVVLDLSTTTSFVINPSGAVLWPLLETGCEIDDLERFLTDSYGLDPASAAVDARAFVGSLQQLGMLEAP